MLIKHPNAAAIDVYYPLDNQSLTLLVGDDGLGLIFLPSIIGLQEDTVWAFTIWTIE